MLRILVFVAVLLTVAVTFGVVGAEADHGDDDFEMGDYLDPEDIPDELETNSSIQLNDNVTYHPPNFQFESKIDEVSDEPQDVSVYFTYPYLVFHLGNETHPDDHEVTLEEEGLRWQDKGATINFDYYDDTPIPPFGPEESIPMEVRFGFTPGFDDDWFEAEVPILDTGNHIDYEVEIEGELQLSILGGNYTTIDGDMDQHADLDGNPFYQFHDVHDVGVVYMDFSWGCERAEHDSPGELEGYQDTITSKINKYMADSIGAMGVEGFDFTHYDNGGEWHNLPHKCPDDFDSDWPYADFIDAALDRSEGEEYFRDNYDATIVVSAGDQDTEDHFGVDRAIYSPSHHAAYVNELDHQPREQILDPRTGEPIGNLDPIGEGVWLHELGHALGYGDLYAFRSGWSGGVAGSAMMGAGAPDLAPFIAPTRTEAHPLASHADCGGNDESVAIEREECPWNSIQELEFLGESWEEVHLWHKTDPIEEATISTDMVTWTENKSTDSRYMFELRGEDTDTIQLENFDGATNASVGEKGIYIYHIGNNNGQNSIFQISNPQMIDWELVEYYADQEDYLNVSKTLSEPTLAHTDSDNEDGYLFEEYIQLPTDSSVAEMQALEFTPDLPESNQMVLIREADVDETHELEVSLNHTVDSSPSSGEMVTPALGLQMESEDGAVSGVDDGELVAEIDGMSTTDIRPYSVSPWALKPAEEPVQYTVNTDQVDYYLSDIENSSPSDEKETASLDLELASYEQEDNETVRVSHESNVEIDRGLEAVPVGASGNLSVQPITANKQSSGDWVQAQLEIPFDDIDLDSVDVSSFKLNGEVQAVHDEQYGFVRNPVDGDQIKLKFPRAEVLDSVEVGESVYVTVSGTTESGEVLMGDDEIRVIDEGEGEPGSTLPSCADWRDQVDHNENVLDVLECPPGLEQAQPGSPVNPPADNYYFDNDSEQQSAEEIPSERSDGDPPATEGSPDNISNQTQPSVPERGEDGDSPEGDPPGEPAVPDSNQAPEEDPSENEGLDPQSSLSIAVHSTNLMQFQTFVNST